MPADPDVLSELREEIRHLRRLVHIMTAEEFGDDQPEPIREPTAYEKARAHWGMPLAAFVAAAGWLWRKRSGAAMGLAAAACGVTVWALVQHGPVTDGGPPPTVTFTRTARTSAPTVTVTRAPSPAGTAAGVTPSGRARVNVPDESRVRPTRRLSLSPKPTQSRTTSHPPTMAPTTPPVAPREPVTRKTCVKVKLWQLGKLRLLCR